MNSTVYKAMSDKGSIGGKKCFSIAPGIARGYSQIEIINFNNLEKRLAIAR
jgi:hypothetical protein